MASKAVSHIRACESPSKTSVWEPAWSPQTQAEAVTSCQKRAQPVCVFAGESPLSRAASFKAGVRSLGSVVMRAAAATMRRTLEVGTADTTTRRDVASSALPPRAVSVTRLPMRRPATTYGRIFKNMEYSFLVLNQAAFFDLWTV